MTLGLECWGQGLKRRMQLINWWSIFKINEELDCSLPGFIMIYDHSFFLFLMVPKHKNLPYVSCFLGSGHFSFQIFLRVFFFFFTALEAKHNVASDGLGFPLWNFFVQCWTRGGHAGKLSLHNLIWQIWYMPKTWHFTIQTFMEQLYVSSTIQHSKSMWSSNHLPKSQGFC